MTHSQERGPYLISLSIVTTSNGSSDPRKRLLRKSERDPVSKLDPNERRLPEPSKSAEDGDDAASMHANPSEAEALGIAASLRRHWPEYLMEFGQMSYFLFCTCLFAVLLEHPSSPVRHFVANSLVRRALMGLSVGTTVVALIKSPWGKQSGGHINPAMTLAFYRLGKVAHWDAVFYAAAQFSGAIGGVLTAMLLLLRSAPGNGAIRYAITAPGMYGSTIAFLAEVTISFLLMIMVLLVMDRPSLRPHTPYFVGSLYAVNITFESPLSGMSMNPARTFGPAACSGYWRSLWIYFIAPTAGMLVAALVFLRMHRGAPPYCAKLYHTDDKRCIFRHGSGE